MKIFRLKDFYEWIFKVLYLHNFHWNLKNHLKLLHFPSFTFQAIKNLIRATLKCLRGLRHRPAIKLIFYVLFCFLMLPVFICFAFYAILLSFLCFLIFLLLYSLLILHQFVSGTAGLCICCCCCCEFWGIFCEILNFWLLL